MQIWQSLILFSSLLISNLVIYKKIISFESSKKILSSIVFAAFLFPLLYGGFYFLSSSTSENFKVIAYGVFFINNAWFLIFLRNSIIGYNQKLNIGKYFLWTIISLLIPISLILFYNPVEEFTEIIFNSAYLIGIFPMTIFVSILLGISVNSLFWGVFASVAFFSLDFAIRTGLIMVIPVDYQIVISELFRAGFITLFSLVSLFGTQIKRESPSEIIKGTKKLNNLLFMLLTVFPVMIFYTAFWQVNINHKKLQENEINVSQEIFMLSIEKLSDYSNKYTRIINDLLNSPSIASAQWKIESYKFSNPEIHSGQIITYKTSPFEGPNVLTNNGMIEFTSDSQKGWAIKMIVDGKKIYEELPLKVEHQFYLFDDQTPVLSPPNQQLQRSDLVFSNKYQYAFESQKKLFDKNMEIIMIFQTPPPELSGFTIYFLFFSVLILVLIWAFYGYYMNNWEKNAKQYLDEVKQESLDYRKKLESLKNSMSFMSKDMSKKDLTAEEIYKRYAYSFDFLNSTNFQQKSDIALSFFYKGLKSRIKNFEEVYLIQKTLSENTIFASSDGSKKGEKVQIDKKPASNQFFINTNTVSLQCVGQEDSEFLLCIQKSDLSQNLLKEQEFTEELLEISKFYIRQHTLLTKNESIFEKTFTLLKMFEKVKPYKYMSHEWYRMLLEEMKNVLNHPVFLAFYEYLENEVQFRYLKKGSLISNVVKVEEANAYLEQLNRDSSVFEHIAPEKSISGFSRSYGTIPFHVKGEKTGLYFEYSDYRVTSQREIELYFFIAKTLSERGDEY
jgi:hypothetical protein